MCIQWCYLEKIAKHSWSRYWKGYNLHDKNNVIIWSIFLKKSMLNFFFTHKKVCVVNSVNLFCVMHIFIFDVVFLLFFKNCWSIFSIHFRCCFKGYLYEFLFLLLHYCWLLCSKLLLALVRMCDILRLNNFFMHFFFGITFMFKFL